MRDNTKFKKIVTVITLLVFLLGFVFSGLSFVFANDDVDDFSFYKISSAASGYMTSSLSPNGDSPGKLKGALADGRAHTPGNAGSFLGFYDVRVTDGGSKGWLEAVSDMGGIEYAHSSFLNLVNDPDNGNAARGLYGYVLYGWSLNEAGFDADSGGLFVTIFKAIIGFLFLVAFVIAEAIPVLFSTIIRFLQLMNPFQFFANASEIHRVDNEIASNIFGRSMGRVVDVMSSFYDLVSDFSWHITLPFMFLILIWMLIFNRRTRTMTRKRFRRFFVRLAYIAIGVVLIGSLYTSSLNSLANSYQPGRTDANDILYSTFVDFEFWVDTSRLALPRGRQLEVDVEDGKGRLSVETLLNLRKIAFDINMEALGYSGKYFNESNSGSNKWDTVTTFSKTQAGKNVSYSTESYQKTYDLLKRYMTNDTYLESSFESSVKSALTKDVSKTGNGDAVKELFNSVDEINDYKDADNIFKHSSVNIFSNGTLMMNQAGNEKLSSGRSDYDNGTYRFYNSTSMYRPGRGLGLESAGLSTLSMYNYLTTDFSKDDSINISSHDLVSGLTRSKHASVTIVGSGMFSILWGLNSLIVLFCIGFIGWYYALGTIIGGIRNSIQVMFYVIPSMFGVMGAIFKVLSLVGLLIIEVLAVIFAYSLVVDIYTGVFIGGSEMVLYQLVHYFSNDALTDLTSYIPPAPNTAASLGHGTLTMVILVSSVFSILLCVGLTFVMIKVKNVLVHAFVESWNKLINLVIGGGHSNSEMSGMNPLKNPVTAKSAMLAGATAGAATAGLNKLLGRGKDEDKEEVKGASRGETNEVQSGTDPQTGEEKFSEESGKGGPLSADFGETDLPSEQENNVTNKPQEGEELKTLEEQYDKNNDSNVKSNVIEKSSEEAQDPKRQNAGEENHSSLPSQEENSAETKNTIPEVQHESVSSTDTEPSELPPGETKPQSIENQESYHAQSSALREGTKPKQGTKASTPSGATTNVSNLGQKSTFFKPGYTPVERAKRSVDKVKETGTKVKNKAGEVVQAGKVKVGDVKYGLTHHDDGTKKTKGRTAFDMTVGATAKATAKTAKVAAKATKVTAKAGTQSAKVGFNLGKNLHQSVSDHAVYNHRPENRVAPKRGANEILPKYSSPKKKVTKKNDKNKK